MSVPADVQEYLKGPSCPAPEGQTSNLENPPNRNIEAFVFAVLCIVLVTTTTMARAYSRICLVKKVHIEDYLGIGAIIPFGAYVCTYFYFARKIGFFVQQWDLPGSVLIDSGYISLTIGISYGLLMLLLKTAIIMEWIRIFVPQRTRNIFYWSSVILIMINSGFYIASTAVTFGNCRPLEKLWHFWIPGTCLESRGRDIASGAINLALDVFILALPQRVIWTLKMNARRKIGIAAAFSVGLLVVATAVGRVQTILTMDYPKDTTNLWQPFNTSYKSSQVFLWSLSEITCIFLVFCVPALPKLFEDQVISSRVTASWRSWMRIPRQPAPNGPNHAHCPSSTGNHSDLQCITGSVKHTEACEPSMQHYAHGHHEFLSGSDSFKAVALDSGDEIASKQSTDSSMEAQEPRSAPNV